ncbi:MAG: GAF domain-containing protein, partial [Deltaproteobacteria bacterium]|nr:GAF domain-containing protein [Deltaproteobacteria bacterium]
VNNLNEDKTHFSIPYVSGIPIPGRQPGDVYSIYGSLSQESLKNPQPSIMHFEEANPELLALFPGLAPVIQAGFRSTMRVPLISKDQVIGILGFLSQKPKAYTDHDLQLAESIGAQIAGIIANVRLYNELKRTVETLPESKMRYQVLVAAVGQSGNGMVMLQDIGPKEGMIVSANEVAQKITGYS